MRKYKNFIKREISEFFRDFSGFGNVLILIAIYSLVFEDKFFILAIEGLAITLLICYSIKVIFHNERPKHLDFTNLLEKIQSGSFPSVHSAIIMYSGLMIISHVNNLLTEIIFTLIILIVGYSRYHLKKHYFKDIVGGYFIGFLMFLLIYSILI